MKIITGEFQLTGPNEIDIPKVIKIWDDRFIIYQWAEEYRLVCYRKNSISTLVKTTISKETATKLIEALSLKNYKGFFNSASAWNSYGYEICRRRPSKPLNTSTEKQ